MARHAAPDIRHDPDRPGRIEIEADDGNAVEYRASSVGGCARALVCAGLGYEPAPTPEWMQEKFDEGHELEPVVVEWLKEGRAFSQRGSTETVAFAEVGGEQQAQTLRIGSVEDADGREWTVNVVAHSDAMGDVIDGNQYPVDIEIKCVGDDLWGDFRRNGVAGLHAYAWQVSARMHAHGLPVAFVVCRKKGSLSAGNLEIVDVLVEIVTEAPIPLRDFKRRLLKIEDWLATALATGELPACDVKQYPCPFWYQHDDQADETRTRIEDDLLKGQLAAYLDASARAKEAEDDKKRLMEGVKAWMEANGMAVDGARYDCDGLKVTYVASFVPSRVTEERTDRYVRISGRKTGTAKKAGSKKAGRTRSTEKESNN